MAAYIAPPRHPDDEYDDYHYGHRNLDYPAPRLTRQGSNDVADTYSDSRNNSKEELRASRSKDGRELRGAAEGDDEDAIGIRRELDRHSKGRVKCANYIVVGTIVCIVSTIAIDLVFKPGWLFSPGGIFASPKETQEAARKAQEAKAKAAMDTSESTSSSVYSESPEGTSGDQEHNRGTNFDQPAPAKEKSTQRATTPVSTQGGDEIIPKEAGPGVTPTVNLKERTRAKEPATQEGSKVVTASTQHLKETPQVVQSEATGTRVAETKPAAETPKTNILNKKKEEPKIPAPPTPEPSRKVVHDGLIPYSPLSDEQVVRAVDGELLDVVNIKCPKSQLLPCLWVQHGGRHKRTLVMDSLIYDMYTELGITTDVKSSSSTGSGHDDLLSGNSWEEVESPSASHPGHTEFLTKNGKTQKKGHSFTQRTAGVGNDEGDGIPVPNSMTKNDLAGAPTLSEMAKSYNLVVETAIEEKTEHSYRLSTPGAPTPGFRKTAQRQKEKRRNENSGKAFVEVGNVGKSVGEVASKPAVGTIASYVNSKIAYVDPRETSNVDDPNVLNMEYDSQPSVPVQHFSQSATSFLQVSRIKSQQTSEQPDVAAENFDVENVVSINAAAAKSSFEEIGAAKPQAGTEADVALLESDRTAQTKADGGAGKLHSIRHETERHKKRREWAQSEKASCCEDEVKQHEETGPREVADAGKDDGKNQATGGKDAGAGGKADDEKGTTGADKLDDQTNGKNVGKKVEEGGKDTKKDDKKPEKEDDKVSLVGTLENLASVGIHSVEKFADSVESLVAKRTYVAEKTSTFMEEMKESERTGEHHKLREKTQREETKKEETTKEREQQSKKEEEGQGQREHESKKEHEQQGEAKEQESVSKEGTTMEETSKELETMLFRNAKNLNLLEAGKRWAVEWVILHETEFEEKIRVDPDESYTAKHDKILERQNALRHKRLTQVKSEYDESVSAQMIKMKTLRKQSQSFVQKRKLTERQAVDQDSVNSLVRPTSSFMQMETKGGVTARAQNSNILGEETILKRWREKHSEDHVLSRDDFQDVLDVYRDEAQYLSKKTIAGLQLELPDSEAVDKETEKRVFVDGNEEMKFKLSMKKDYVDLGKRAPRDGSYSGKSNDESASRILSLGSGKPRVPYHGSGQNSQAKSHTVLSNEDLQWLKAMSSPMTAVYDQSQFVGKQVNAHFKSLKHMEQSVIPVTIPASLRIQHADPVSNAYTDSTATNKSSVSYNNRGASPVVGHPDSTAVGHPNLNATSTSPTSKTQLETDTQTYVLDADDDDKVIKIEDEGSIAIGDDSASTSGNSMPPNEASTSSSGDPSTSNSFMQTFQWSSFINSMMQYSGTSGANAGEGTNLGASSNLETDQESSNLQAPGNPKEKGSPTLSHFPYPSVEEIKSADAYIKNSYNLVYGDIKKIATKTKKDIEELSGKLFDDLLQIIAKKSDPPSFMEHRIHERKIEKKHRVVPTPEIQNFDLRKGVKSMTGHSWMRGSKDGSESEDWVNPETTENGAVSIELDPNQSRKIMISVVVGGVDMSMDEDPEFRESMGWTDINQSDLSKTKDMFDELVYVADYPSWEQDDSNAESYNSKTVIVGCGHTGKRRFVCSNEMNGWERIQTYVSMNMELSQTLFAMVGFSLSHDFSRPIPKLDDEHFDHEWEGGDATKNADGKTKSLLRIVQKGWDKPDKESYSHQMDSDPEKIRRVQRERNPGPRVGPSTYKTETIRSPEFFRTMERKSIPQKAGVVGLQIFDIGENDLDEEASSMWDLLGWSDSEKQKNKRYNLSGLPHQSSSGASLHHVYNGGLAYVIFPDRDNPNYLAECERAGSNLINVIATYNVETRFLPHLPEIEVVRFRLDDEKINLNISGAARFQLGIMRELERLKSLSGIRRVEVRVNSNGDKVILERSLEKLMNLELD